jgi:O-antigen/teichoic acid export membrane protein
MIMGMNYFVGVGIFLKNQTKYYLFPSLSAAIINIALNYFLIPRYGMMGAAFSILSAQTIYTTLLALFSSKHLAIHFEWGKVFLVFLISIIFFEIDQFLRIGNFWINMLTGFLILLAFPLILYKFNFFETIEIRRLKEGLQKLFTRI